MILDFPTIGNKRIVRNPDGDQIVELGETVIDYKQELDVEDYMVVTEELAGKPWSITKILYGSERILPIFFFFNGYANPYSVQEGDTLLKFTQASMNAATKDNNNITKELYNFSPDGEVGNGNSISDNETVNLSKLPKVDQNRVKALQKLKNAGKGLSQNQVSQLTGGLEPNQSDGAARFEASDGIITLGTDISETRCKTDLSDVQTRTEQIRAAVIKKIKLK